jgi:DNA-binding NarL/FixJ family response regulator
MSLTTVIVDDHAGFRASARVLLEMEGFDVIGEAVDGATAVATVENLRPQLVVLDVQLPDTLGFQVCREIVDRGLTECVVLVSSRDAGEYGDSIASSGALGFIPKAELSGSRLRALLSRNPKCA